MRNPESLPKVPSAERVQKRFWAKVDKRGQNECWIWKGGTSRHGYGAFWHNGKLRRAPRVSWELHNEMPFPEGKVACHKCDNPPCVNPLHIWAGTLSENVQDAISKGRLKGPYKKRKPLNKSHCHKGHEFSKENTYIDINKGRKSCRICRRSISENFRARRKAARKAATEKK